LTNRQKRDLSSIKTLRSAFLSISSNKSSLSDVSIISIDLEEKIPEIVEEPEAKEEPDNLLPAFDALFM